MEFRTDADTGLSGALLFSDTNLRNLRCNPVANNKIYSPAIFFIP